ncbi:unnamed protein product [Darwinula stevensoni]|uniref:Potassium channel domain-containing protein n=1 Tax=Darwinula stevensoni TaxID=69355 RepID=A0A7R9ABI0_9CRUS|nr:unnamed protein product [Darwinula stevensoni]CAG0899470.1 unnamed protein product [Darwinula stevensoni]
MVYAGFGIPLTLFCVTKVATTLADALFSAYGRCERRRAASRKEQRHAAVDATGEEAKAPKRFPVSLVLFLLLGYACGGALLFSLWEGWLFIDGLYFCFDTLSTIGFGDILPGRAVSHEVTFVEQAKIVAGCLYLLFGLTMVVMSFELVQAEVNAKVKELGAFIGFVDEEKRESRSDKK